MNTTIQKINGQKIALIESPHLIIFNKQQVLDLMADAGYLGARAIILPAKNLYSNFFDLKTVIAGNILQKFSNYQEKLAIVDTFDHYHSQSLAAFIRESNRGNLICFVPDIETAKRYLDSR